MRSASVLLASLAILATAPAPAAAGVVPTLDVCVNPGPPPKEPHVQVGECGPEMPKAQVVLLLATPAGTIERAVGNCDADCDYRITLQVSLCRTLGPAGPERFVDWTVPSLPDSLLEGVSTPGVVDAVIPYEDEVGECETYVRRSLETP